MDNFSRYYWFYPMRQKPYFLQIFIMWQTMVEKQLNQKILMFQCVGGCECTSNNFLTHLSNHGIKQMISCPYTPQQNGLEERKHKHITELGLSMLFDGNLPQNIRLAFFTSSFLGNLLLSSSLSETRVPMKLYSTRKLSILL